MKLARRSVTIVLVLLLDAAAARAEQQALPPGWGAELGLGAGMTAGATYEKLSAGDNGGEHPGSGFLGHFSARVWRGPLVAGLNLMHSPALSKAADTPTTLNLGVRLVPGAWRLSVLAEGGMHSFTGFPRSAEDGPTARVLCWGGRATIGRVTSRMVTVGITVIYLEDAGRKELVVESGSGADFLRERYRVGGRMVGVLFGFGVGSETPVSRGE